MGLQKHSSAPEREYTRRLLLVKAITRASPLPRILSWGEEWPSLTATRSARKIMGKVPVATDCDLGSVSLAPCFWCKFYCG